MTNAHLLCAAISALPHLLRLSAGRRLDTAAYATLALLVQQRQGSLVEIEETVYGMCDRWNHLAGREVFGEMGRYDMMDNDGDEMSWTA